MAYTEDDLEAFKELGNIGAGHAAIALTKFLAKEVDMTVPFVRIGQVEEMVNVLELDNEEIVGYEISEVEEPLKYKMSVLFKSSVILRVLQLFASTTLSELKSEDDLTHMQKSTLQEIGSIIILRYIAAINKMMKVDSMPSIAPTFTVGKPQEALASSTYPESNGEIMLIQLDLFTEEYSFECHIFIQPHPKDIDAYRKALHIT